MRRLRISGQVGEEIPKEVLYEDLRRENCTLCPLHKTAEYVCLIGRGNLDADIFLIGEAPGHREDDVGRPFAGRSGQLLDTILEELDHPREEVYISNVVHCRPPDNRTPTGKEIKICKQYLDKELRLVKPKVIIPMGNTALKAVVGRAGITNLRGKTFKHETLDAVICPTFHPAAILRNPGNLDFLVEDLDRAFRLVDTKPEFDTCDRKLIESFSDLAHMVWDIMDKGICSFDCEANTVQWWRDDVRIAMLQFSCEKGKAYVVPLDHKESPFNDVQVTTIMDILDHCIFSNENVAKVGQNVKFDCHMVIAKYEVTIKGKIHDTMYLHYLLNENVPHNLDSMSLQYLNYGEYWNAVNELGLKKGLAPEIPLKVLGEYGAIDADVTLQIFYKIYPEVEKSDKFLNIYDYVLIPALWTTLEAEEVGMAVDLDALDVLSQKMKDEKVRIIDRLNSFKEVKRAFKSMKASRTKKFESINFGSFQQAAEVLFSKAGFSTKYVRKTDAGNKSTDEETLVEIIGRGENVGKFAGTLLELRKLNALNNTFVTGMYKHIATDERVHPNFKVTGTKPGRMSCGKPNLQNIPRAEPIGYDHPMKAEVKTIFVPGKRKVFLKGDYSQAELRVMCHFSGEERMIQWFNDGKDVHRYVAMEMLGLDEEAWSKLSKDDAKAKRKSSKKISFGIIYCIAKYTLAEHLSSPTDGIFYTSDEAQEFLDQYFSTFPAIPEMIDSFKELAQNQGYVETLFGRRRRLPDVKSTERFVREEALRQAVNSPIQGTAGEFTVFAMNLLNGRVDDIRRLPSSCHIINQVHDEIFTEILPRDVDKTAKIMKQVMENLPTKKYFEVELSVPMVAELEVCDKSWAKAEKLDI